MKKQHYTRNDLVNVLKTISHEIDKTLHGLMFSDHPDQHKYILCKMCMSDVSNAIKEIVDTDEFEKGKKELDDLAKASKEYDLHEEENSDGQSK